MVEIKRILIAALLITLPLSGCKQEAMEGTAAATASDAATLTISTATAKRTFRVEIASTPEEQQQGLMFRTKIAKDAGMIFPMLPPRDASFWMKNTLIPLDMIFIRPDGVIARIEANTVPESLTPVQSGEPVIAVLEIAGGEAQAQGISAGDKVSLPF